MKKYLALILTMFVGAFFFLNSNNVFANETTLPDEVTATSQIDGLIDSDELLDIYNLYIKFPNTSYVLFVDGEEVTSNDELIDLYIHEDEDLIFFTAENVTTYDILQLVYDSNGDYWDLDTNGAAFKLVKKSKDSDDKFYPDDYVNLDSREEVYIRASDMVLNESYYFYAEAGVLLNDNGSRWDDLGWSLISLHLEYIDNVYVLYIDYYVDDIEEWRLFDYHVLDVLDLYIGLKPDELETIMVNDISELPALVDLRLRRVTFEVLNYTVVTTIEFLNKHYVITKEFDFTTDFDLFDTIEAYYINDAEYGPQIIINHSDRPYLRDILESPENEKPAFIPHSIWYLDTNKVKTYNSYNTHVHIKQNSQGVMIAYMYIDEFIMDKLLTAHLEWKSYLATESWWGLKTTTSDLEHHEEILTSDSYLDYKNKTTHFSNFFPGWNFFRGVYTDRRTYEMPRIDSLRFDGSQPQYNVTQSELLRYFRKVNFDFDNFNSDPRYKVWALSLQSGINLTGPLAFKHEETKIYHNYDDINDPNNLKIIRLTYETDGKLYEALGSDMDLKLSGSEKDVGDKTEDDNKLMSLIDKIYIGSLIVFYFIVLNKNGGFRKAENFIKITIIFAILAAIIYFAFIKTMVLIALLL